MKAAVAGLQAGIVTLAFILLAAFGYLSGGAEPVVVPTWSVMIAALTAFTLYVIDKENPIMIAVVVIVFGLMCTGVFMITNAYEQGKIFSVMGISITAGLLLGGSWSIVLMPQKTREKETLFKKEE